MVLGTRWQFDEPASTPQRSAFPSEWSPLLARCLALRGIQEEADVDPFLNPRLKDLHDPFLLPMMEQAVARLQKARANGEEILVFGDYDVDGVTATTIILTLFQHFGIPARAYLPGRFDEGYGLSEDAVERCLAEGMPGLLLAVDCGSTSVDAINLLNRKGVDVIVLDHHQLSDPAPAALAMVNPQTLAQDEHHQRDLCSAGLAFKLAHAMVKQGREQGDEKAVQFDVRCLLDLCALGTVADLVPIRGENRVLVKHGLRRLELTTRHGLRALMEVAGVEPPIAPFHLGFLLGPRLNAAGRMDHAQMALDLLTASDESVAYDLAARLDAHNRERQEVEQGITQEVIARIQTWFDPEKHWILVEGDASWHLGVVGIVAARVLREFNRPVFILGGDGEHWRGSGRGIEGLDLAELLRECDDLLLHHGGHAMAAGVTLDPSKIKAFREAINKIARERLDPVFLKPLLRLDAMVPSLNVLTLEEIRRLSCLEPFGQTNPPVQLAVSRVKMLETPRAIGRSGRHLLLKVTDGTATRDAVWWNAEEPPPQDEVFDLAFRPEINAWRGKESVRLNVLAWRPHVEDSSG